MQQNQVSSLFDLDEIVWARVTGCIIYYFIQFRSLLARTGMKHKIYKGFMHLR